MNLTRVIFIAVTAAACAAVVLAVIAQVYVVSLADGLWRSLPVVVCVCAGVILPQYSRTLNKGTPP